MKSLLKFRGFLVPLLLCAGLSLGWGSRVETTSRRGICGRIDLVREDPKSESCAYLLQFSFRDNDPLQVCTTQKELVLIDFQELADLRRLLDKDIIVVFHPPSDPTAKGAVNHLVKIYRAEL